MDIQSINKIGQAVPVIADRLSGSSPPTEVANAAPTQTAAAVKQASKPPSAAEVSDAVNKINQTLKNVAQNLEFSVDKESDRVVVKIIDQQTKETVRQIPTEEALEISKSLDKLQGLLIKQSA
jgi:flagellar protein FlaG